MKMLSCLLLSLGLLVGGFSLSAQEASTKSSPAKAPAPGTYQIRNQKYGDLLRPQDANSADGTRLVLYSAQPWKCMTWRLQPEKESAFRVQNLFTSKTFAVGGKGEATNSTVVQVPLAQSGAPVWQFTRLKNGSYRITEPKSGKVLTAVKGGNDSQVTIAVEPWRDGEEQKWELQKMDPKQLTM